MTGLDYRHVLTAEPADVATLLANFDPMTWATKTAGIVLPKSGPLTFERHPYLVSIYRDTHPNIVAIYEYGEDDACAWIAMELVQGKPLQTF